MRTDILDECKEIRSLMEQEPIITQAALGAEVRGMPGTRSAGEPLTRQRINYLLSIPLGGKLRPRDSARLRRAIERIRKAQK